MSSATNISRGAACLGASVGLALGNVAVDTLRAAARATAESAREAHAWDTVAAWSEALDAEREVVRELSNQLADAHALVSDLDEALADVSTENDVLKQEIADLRRRLMRRAS